MTARSVLPEKQIHTVEVKTIPVLPEPIMIKTEQAPTLTLPPVMVINSDEASYYLEACEDFKKAGQQDEYTLEKLQAQYEGLSQDDACNFNIYGFTLQGWLSLEAQMVKVAGYVEKLRSQIDYLEKKIQERQKIIKQREMILKKGSENSGSVTYR
jgi:hypothetical protein